MTNDREVLLAGFINGSLLRVMYDEDATYVEANVSYADDGCIDGVEVVARDGAVFKITVMQVKKGTSDAV